MAVGRFLPWIVVAGFVGYVWLSGTPRPEGEAQRAAQRVCPMYWMRAELYEIAARDEATGEAVSEARLRDACDVLLARAAAPR